MMGLTLDLADCVLTGPALPEPFARFELAGELRRLGLLPAEDRPTELGWERLRRHLQSTPASGGAQRIRTQIVAPLAACLGYAPPARADGVVTRHGEEDGGWLLRTPLRTGKAGALRVWAVAPEIDLDTAAAPSGQDRHSPCPTAQRVLLAAGERAGLLTNGYELRLLLSDPIRRDSTLSIALNGSSGWRERRIAPDSYRLLVALVRPQGLAALPVILEAARLSQVRVTQELRLQARGAVEGFVQALLDHPANRSSVRLGGDTARRLWEEGLVLVYRLLFILKLESSTDAERAFSFASTPLWQGALSPNRALGALVRRHLDHGHNTGRMLEDGLRTVFRVFRDGLICREMRIAPLGGALFASEAMAMLEGMTWGERAVALLLDRLLWTQPGPHERRRVHYGALDVEELGRVYEALLELEPGIAGEPMARMRRARQETVVPASAEIATAGIMRVEEIAAGSFFLCAGQGRKATGSYYTPDSFVRFLVREALGPQISRRSPDDDPDPAALLALRVIDPAAGSGHFLVECCRYLGEALHAACRRCDVDAAAAERAASHADTAERERLWARAATLQGRLSSVSDEALEAYLPSRCRDAGAGVSEGRALAICRRLVAVHCLYGVDRNPLAIELAKLSLWLESYAEGLPLTFLDHRLQVGDSLAAPFFADLATLPVSRGPLDPLLARGVADRLASARAEALHEVACLEASVGRDIADLAVKAAAKRRLDGLLGPLANLARAWSGAVALGERDCDDCWLAVARTVAETGVWPERLTPAAARLLHEGRAALPWDLVFPEVFLTGGFDAVLGNPPWDVVQYKTKDFVAGFDLAVLDSATKKERAEIEARYLADPDRSAEFDAYRQRFTRQKRLADRLFQHQRDGLRRGFDGNLDLYRLFAERMLALSGPEGCVGVLLPSAFHGNEGATGVRRLFLRETRLETCLSFENRRRLFDIDSRFRFDLVVARRPGPTTAVRCAFWLDGLEQANEPGRMMEYDRAFLDAAGGPYVTLPELRGPDDLAIARGMFAEHPTLGAWCREAGVHFGRDLHMTDDAGCFERINGPSSGGHTLHEGKTFHRYTDQWETAPRYFVPKEALAERPAIAAASRHYRLVFRDIARSSDERTMIATVAPPGVVFGHTATVERRPELRPNSVALTLCALLNSYSFDWVARQRVGTHLSRYIIDALPVPRLAPEVARFLALGALRLCASHCGYDALWREQTHGPRRPMDDLKERGRLLAEIDAVVAHAYGLSRPAYEVILGCFNHRACIEMPQWCLDAYDVSSRDMRSYCRGFNPIGLVAGR